MVSELSTNTFTEYSVKSFLGAAKGNPGIIGVSLASFFAKNFSMLFKIFSLTSERYKFI